MDDQHRVTDEQLVEIARRGGATAAMVGDIAVELLAARKRSRADSRRAEQIRKLRWAAENTLAKIESLATADLELIAAQERAEAAEDCTTAAEARLRDAALALRKLRDRLGDVDVVSRVTPDGVIHEFDVDIMKELELLLTRMEAP